MDDKTAPIAIGIELENAPPESIDAGVKFSFAVRVTWPEGSGPEDAGYLVRAGDKVIHSGDLPKAAEDGSITFAFTAPEEVGDHRWVLTVAWQGRPDDKRFEGTLPLALTTVPHSTSLAVWDNPSPLVRGSRFEVKVGAKCSASCGLHGRQVEIRDEDDKVMGSGALGDATWAGTASLYWTTVQLDAPSEIRLHSWTVNFSGKELKLAHGGATARFSFVTVAEPEHSVQVKVVNKKTRAPIPEAQVRLGLYRAVTDETGSVKVSVPAGRFRLTVTRAGYDMPERNIKVSKDIRVRVAAEALPEEDPFSAWTA